MNNKKINIYIEEINIIIVKSSNYNKYNISNYHKTKSHSIQNKENRLVV